MLDLNKLKANLEAKKAEVHKSKLEAELTRMIIETEAMNRQNDFKKTLTGIGPEVVRKSRVVEKQVPVHSTRIDPVVEKEPEADPTPKEELKGKDKITLEFSLSDKAQKFYGGFGTEIYEWEFTGNYFYPRLNKPELDKEYFAYLGGNPELIETCAICGQSHIKHHFEVEYVGEDEALRGTKVWCGSSCINKHNKGMIVNLSAKSKKVQSRFFIDHIIYFINKYDSDMAVRYQMMYQKSIDGLKYVMNHGMVHHLNEKDAGDLFVLTCTEHGEKYLPMLKQIIIDSTDEELRDYYG